MNLRCSYKFSKYKITLTSLCFLSFFSLQPPAPPKRRRAVGWSCDVIRLPKKQRNKMNIIISSLWKIWGFYLLQIRGEVFSQCEDIILNYNTGDDLRLSWRIWVFLQPFVIIFDRFMQISKPIVKDFLIDCVNHKRPAIGEDFYNFTFNPCK